MEGSFLSSLGTILDFQVLPWLLIGVLVGMVIGALPGLSTTLGVVLVLPLTFGWSPIQAFALLMGLYMSSVYAGSISAILVGIPGTPAAVMTVLDGHPMTQKGEASRAIGLATIASVVGGLLGSIVLMTAAPAIARLALKFGPHEYFAIGFLGLSVLAYVSPGSMTKGIIAASIGLLISTVGVDPVWAYPRFTFNSVQLVGGIELLAILLGVFGFTEVLSTVEAREDQDFSGISHKLGRLIPRYSEIKPFIPVLCVGSLIGIGIGIVPAVGGATAIIIAYGIAKRISKNPEQFGYGAPDAICSVESANNGSVGGAMVPLLSLGIPGDATTVVLFGAFLLHGLTPGPLLFRDNPEITYAIFIYVFMASILIAPVGFLVAKTFYSRIISLRPYTLYPLVLFLVIIGSYSIRSNFFDSWIVMLFGLLGYLMRKAKIPLAPILMGVVLGPIMERNLVRALIITKGNLLSFFLRPISASVILITIFVILIPSIRSAIKSAYKRSSNSSKETPHK